MAANDFLNDENLDNTSDRITAFFPNKDDAYRAMTELKRGGFSSNQIGLAALDDDMKAKNELAGSNPDMHSDLAHHEPGEHQSFWQEVKDFFSGESHDDATDVETSTSDMSWSGDRSAYYAQGLNSGGALVTVTGGNNPEARRILESCGGDLREGKFETGQPEKFAPDNTGIQPETTEFANNVGGTQGNIVDIGKRSIQLRGELLRAHKERVQRGDVRLRKEVITENKTIEVPVTREELVIERNQPTNVHAPGEIGSDSEIRIPLSEERVIAEKHAVVNEEISVGKRQVTDMERVSDNVRHEELKVEEDSTGDGDFDINRKKPAA